MLSSSSCTNLVFFCLLNEKIMSLLHIIVVLFVNTPPHCFTFKCFSEVQTVSKSSETDIWRLALSKYLQSYQRWDNMFPKPFVSHEVSDKMIFYVYMLCLISPSIDFCHFNGCLSVNFEWNLKHPL